MRRLAAVVLNWRTPELTVRAVEALVADGLPPDRVVVVDNGSSDGSGQRLAGELPHSHVIELEENIGFARANNAGARALRSDEGYLFVNSDAFVHLPGSLERLGDALSDAKVGIAVPRLRNQDLTLQRTVVPASTPLPELVRAIGLSRLVPNRLQPALGAHWDHSHSRRIQAAMGAVMLVRARAWQQLGGFNERRFMYAEDLDLFWRAASLGWRTQFVAEAEFIHLGGASTGLLWDDPARAALVAEAQADMIRARLSPGRARASLALMSGGTAARALVHRLRGDELAAATQRAWCRGFLSPRARARVRPR